MLKAAGTRIKLTPQGEFYLIGYGPRYESRKKPAAGIHDDIYANPVLLEMDGQEVFIFNADVIEFEEAFCLEMKARLAKEYGLKENLILFSATHDHSSVMDYHKHWSTGRFSESYYEELKSIICRSVEECRSSLREVEAWMGKGRVEGCYGSRIYFGEPADQEVILVEFRDAQGQVAAALCNWATHSTVISPEHDQLTSDFAGQVCARLIELKGYAPAMIVGAAGDCSNRAYRQGSDFAELDRVSRMAAEQIAAITVNQKLNITYEGDDFITDHIQYKPSDDRPFYEAKLAELNQKLQQAEGFEAIKLVKDDLGQITKKMNMKEVNVTLSSSILHLGELEIITIPGELGSELGINLKRTSHAPCCLIFGYTNGYFSYILQPRLYKDSCRAIGSRYRAEDVDALYRKNSSTAERRRNELKLIIRADDFGYTPAFNDGAMESILNGITTSADLMLETPGTLDAMEKIKACPWISIGWHAHFWGSPVADPACVPSMIDETGRFKFRKDPSLKQSVVFEEALLECRAEVDRCIQVLGKAPDTTWIHGDDPVERARRQVCDEYHILYDFARKIERQHHTELQAAEKYRELDIFMPCQHDSVYKILYSDYAQQREAYDPVRYFIEDPDQLKAVKVAITAWHPGYLDSHVYLDSSRHFNLARPIDTAALCSAELKQWIIDNQVELVNHRDAILGTSEYQNHLRAVGSPLCLAKIKALKKAKL